MLYLNTLFNTHRVATEQLKGLIDRVVLPVINKARRKRKERPFEVIVAERMMDIQIVVKKGKKK